MIREPNSDKTEKIVKSLIRSNLCRNPLFLTTCGENISTETGLQSLCTERWTSLNYQTTSYGASVAAQGSK